MDDCYAFMENHFNYCIDYIFIILIILKTNIIKPRIVITAFKKP